MIGRLGFIGVFLAASCQPVPAQDHPQTRFYSTPRDVVTLSEVISGAEYLLEYHNSASHASRDHPVEVEHEGFLVNVHVTLSAGPETIQPLPPEGWISIPHSLDIMDGDTGSFRIIPQEQWQGM